MWNNQKTISRATVVFCCARISFFVCWTPSPIPNTPAFIPCCLQWGGAGDQKGQARLPHRRGGGGGEAASGLRPARAHRRRGRPQVPARAALSLRRPHHQGRRAGALLRPLRLLWRVRARQDQPRRGGRVSARRLRPGDRQPRVHHALPQHAQAGQRVLGGAASQ